VTAPAGNSVDRDRAGSAGGEELRPERPEAEEAAAAPGPAADQAAAEPAATPDPAAEAAEFRDRWLRAEAEIQNVRRRAAREREELRRELEDRWLLEAAALLDDLDRGLAAARESGAPDAWIRGFELAGGRIRELLERHGVSVVEPAGQPFDPRFHEALLEVEPPAGAAPGTVAHVVSRGYARDGRSLRAARVAVARAPGEGESAT